MLKFPAPFPNAIFVCTHKRPDGHPKPCCANRGGKDLRDELKEKGVIRGKEREFTTLISKQLSHMIVKRSTNIMP